MTREYPYPLDGSSLLFITDLHLGRRGWTARQLEIAGDDVDHLEKFVDGVGVGGDLIHWAVAETPEDPQWRAWYATRTKNVPWARVAGNHDYASFGPPEPARSATQWLTAINETGQNQVFDLGEMRIISLSPDTWTRATWNAGMALSTDTLNWFEATLAASSKPTWVVAHNPLTQQYPGHIQADTQARLNSIIGGSNNVVGWLSGHRHADIRTDTNHAKRVVVGGRAIAAINGPAAGGEVAGTAVDPWDSPLHCMILTYKDGVVTCRWRNVVTRSWVTFQGSRTLDIAVDA